MRIAFFPRNLNHLRLYGKLRETIAKEYPSTDVNIVYETSSEISDVDFAYEEHIESVLRTDVSNVASLEQFLQKYPSFNFNKAILSERELVFFPSYFNYGHMKYKEICAYTAACFHVMEMFLDSVKPDIVYGELILGLADAILYEICKVKGVKYLSVRQSKVGNGIIVCDPYVDLPINHRSKYEAYLAENPDSECFNEARQYLDNLKQRIEKPVYMEKTGQNYRLFPKHKVAEFIRRITQASENKEKLILKRRPLLNPVFWHATKLINIVKTKIYGNHWFVDLENIDSPYVIFPLHYEPESSTLVRGAEFSDQLGVIKFISRHLPLGIILVVKEHGGNHGYRKPEFYQEVSHLPNVVLVSRDQSPRELIKNSAAIITITGRMGWEALVYGKSVICLGNAFWSTMPGVQRCKQWSDLIEALRSVSKEADTPSASGVELLAFTAAYIECNHQANFVLNSSQLEQEKNIQSLAGLFSQNHFDVLSK
ncbi:hypothetical protein BTA51_00165 [Hahella sp. CCB-MM4]|uniref:capsular polysaccharide export protein, LipB/KpsS family n=1 Tax=Hahella sp. (strain CCB-MM4) TaxID=1926491 RepID=UPI000B9BF270|nr:hypothetical protein [Hahella sp. CCB-MM4]OZG74864.1 hypothetical protein BTA51_00165 [Hahella sp. CCB-MM4]